MWDNIHPFPVTTHSHTLSRQNENDFNKFSHGENLSAYSDNLGWNDMVWKLDFLVSFPFFSWKYQLHISGTGTILHKQQSLLFCCLILCFFRECFSHFLYCIYGKCWSCVMCAIGVIKTCGACLCCWIKFGTSEAILVKINKNI